MRVWLLAAYEFWPIDSDAPRLLRAGINAKFLTTGGHEVVWWNSTFNHSRRRERDIPQGYVDTDDGYRVVGLRGGGYKHSISVGRIIHHRNMARHFRGLCSQYPKPDVIVASLTPLELARAAVEYGHRVGCPVVVDIRDMWPDIWLEFVPEWVRPLARPALWPFYRDLKKIVLGATSIIGITDAAVDWALMATGRPRSPLERSFPLAYPAENIARDQVASAREWWRQHGIADDGTIIGCYFGSLSKRNDFETPIKALQGLPPDMLARVKLVLCGLGEAEASIRESASGVSNIVIPGWIDAAQIRALMEVSSFGLLPYRSTLDFVRSLPNKVFEYLSGHLPIVTSLRGEIEQFFAHYPCGILYEVENPRSFQDALTKIITTPELLSNARKAAAKAAEDYDFKKVCSEFESYLRRIAR
jgi:glycosyltransferase involved in cell wall biosynthesis